MCHDVQISYLVFCMYHISTKVPSSIRFILQHLPLSISYFSTKSINSLHRMSRNMSPHYADPRLHMCHYTRWVVKNRGWYVICKTYNSKPWCRMYKTITPYGIFFQEQQLTMKLAQLAEPEIVK